MQGTKMLHATTDTSTTKQCPREVEAEGRAAQEKSLVVKQLHTYKCRPF